MGKNEIGFNDTWEHTNKKGVTRMPDKKLTYAKTYNPCDDCLHSFTKNNQESNECKICEFKQSLELNDRLQAENERLKNDFFKRHYAAKAEAVTEFVERLKEYVFRADSHKDGFEHNVVDIDDVYNLSKEFMGAERHTGTFPTINKELGEKK